MAVVLGSVAHLPSFPRAPILWVERKMALWVIQVSLSPALLLAQ